MNNNVNNETWDYKKDPLMREAAGLPPLTDGVSRPTAAPKKKEGPSYAEAVKLAETYVEPSMFDKIKYGFDSMPSFSESLANYAERNLPLGRIEFDFNTMDVKYVAPPQELLDAIEQSKRTELAIAEQGRPPSFEEAVAIDAPLQWQREEHQKQLAEDYPNIHGTSDARGAAVIAGNFLGAIADPTTLLPVGRTGAQALGIGAGIGAADMAAYNLGEQGYVDVTDVAIGATLGGGVGLLVQKGGKAFRDWAYDRKVNGVPVSERDIAEQQVKYQAFDKDPRQLADIINERMGINRANAKSAEQAKVDMNKALKEDPEYTEFLDRYARTQDDLRDIGKRSAKTNAMLEKQAQMDAAWDARNATIRAEAEELSKKFLKQVDKIKAADEAYGKKVGQKPPPEFIRRETVMEKAFKKSAAESGKSVEEVRKMFKQSGELNQQLMNHMASTTVGSGLGYWSTGDAEGAMMGAAIGLGLPWAAGRVYKRLGTLSEASEKFVVDNMSSPFVSPATKFEYMGNYGRAFGRAFQRTIENIDLKHAEAMYHSAKRLGSLTKEEKKIFIEAIRKDIKRPFVPKNIRRVVEETEKDFRKVIRESIKTGVIPKVDGERMLKDALEKGYWPRVYNEAFLSSAEGKAKWVEVFTSKGWTEDGLRKTLNSIMREDQEAINEIIKFAKKDGSAFYLTRAQAMKMLERRGHHVRKNRSSHLEHSRKIQVDDEKLLDPFLVHEPHAVLTSYFHDAFKRIEMARSFGANDDLAMQFAEGVRREVGDKEAEYLQRVYFTAVGDSRSEAITKYLKMNDVQRRMLSGINAFETLKLSFAQTINAGQALINGSTYLAGRVNPAETWRITAKSLFKSFGKEAREVADRSGAALETVVLQTIGEFSESTSIAGKEFRGWLSFVEFVNNPSKFLKATGFIDVELFQRRFAANMGKAYAESLLAKKALIEAGKITGSRAEKIIKQMDEIGLSTNVQSHLVPEEDMLRASLRFSNEVNFRNTPDKLALGWQTPYAKIFTKFKSFAFHHGKFVKNNVLSPAYKGNFLPLFNYLAVGTPMGMGVDEFRRMLKGDDSELSNTERVLRGFTSVGGLGILMDTVASSAYSASAPIAALAGPFISDLGKMLHGTYNSLDQGSIKPAARAAIGTQVFPMKKALMEELKTSQKAKVRGRNSASRSTARRSSKRNNASR